MNCFCMNCYAEHSIKFKHGARWLLHQNNRIFKMQFIFKSAFVRSFCFYCKYTWLAKTIFEEKLRKGIGSS